jgi:hypothetical protein
LIKAGLAAHPERLHIGIMTSGDEYRKRAKVLEKRMKSANRITRVPLSKKRKALEDMADNEDWLDGKPKAKK